MHRSPDNKTGALYASTTGSLRFLSIQEVGKDYAMPQQAQCKRNEKEDRLEFIKKRHRELILEPRESLTEEWFSEMEDDFEHEYLEEEVDDMDDIAAGERV